MEVDIEEVAEELMVGGDDAGLRTLTSQLATITKLKTNEIINLSQIDNYIRNLS